MTFEAQMEVLLRRVVREELRDALTEMQAPAPAMADDSRKVQLLTVPEVARRCGDAHPATVRAWITSKRLKASRPGRHYMVKISDLEAFLAGPPVSVEPDADVEVARILGRIGRK